MIALETLWGERGEVLSIDHCCQHHEGNIILDIDEVRDLSARLIQWLEGKIPYSVTFNGYRCLFCGGRSNLVTAFKKHSYEPVVLCQACYNRWQESAAKFTEAVAQRKSSSTPSHPQPSESARTESASPDLPPAVGEPPTA